MKKFFLWLSVGIASIFSLLVIMAMPYEDFEGISVENVVLAHLGHKNSQSRLEIMYTLVSARSANDTYYNQKANYWKRKLSQ